MNSEGTCIQFWSKQNQNRIKFGKKSSLFFDNCYGGSNGTTYSSLNQALNPQKDVSGTYSFEPITASIKHFILVWILSDRTRCKVRRNCFPMVIGLITLVMKLDPQCLLFWKLGNQGQTRHS